jgi:hypothetical protein
MIHIKVEILQGEEKEEEERGGGGGGGGGVLPCRVSKCSSLNVMGFYTVQLFLEKDIEILQAVLIFLYYCVGAKCMPSENSKCCFYKCTVTYNCI